MNPLTDETRSGLDDISDVEVELSQSGITYRARFIGSAMAEVRMIADDPQQQQVTLEMCRAVPGGRLRQLAFQEMRRRALLIPMQIDRDLMTVPYRDRGEASEQWADVVLALAIAEQLRPDRPVDFFAEVNQISRATAYRWKKAAADAGALTPEAASIALAFWRQAKAREAQQQSWKEDKR